MDTPVFIEPQRSSYISPVQTLDAVKKSYQEQWPIGMDGERDSKNPCYHQALMMMMMMMNEWKVKKKKKKNLDKFV